MTDRWTDAELTARLQVLWTDELARADADYPPIPTRPATRAQLLVPMSLIAVVVVTLALAVLLRGIGGVPSPGGIPLGSDGLPVAIGGEPVLRGQQIADRLQENDLGTFLAGGRMTLVGTGCPSSASSGCTEQWRLESVDSPEPLYSVALAPVGAGSGFVRTSGALTVARVQPRSQPGCGQVCETTLVIEKVIWREPTKGPVPSGSASGGESYDGLWPDFISTYGRDGVSIAGYIPKQYLLSGSHAEPMPVYGEDLKTLVGYQVAGVGFVPIEEFSATPVPSAPPVDASPLTVLTAYLQAVQDRNCPAALAAATTDFTPNTNAFCASSIRITGFEINPTPARPNATEEVFGLTLTTQGGDFNLPDGDHTWFYKLTYQSGIGWRVSGGGTGP